MWGAASGARFEGSAGLKDCATNPHMDVDEFYRDDEERRFQSGTLRDLLRGLDDRPASIPSLGVARRARVARPITLAGFETSSIHGVGAPHGTPPEIVDLLIREVTAALADPLIKQRPGELGAVPVAGNACQFGAMLTGEAERCRKIVELSGQKKD
jgi:hypothetical protein